MTTDGWQRVAGIYHAVLARDTRERDTFLRGNWPEA